MVNPTGIAPEPLWTSAEAAAATEGRSTGDWIATGVSIDSRTLAAGDLFVAIAGPTFDAHDFVDEAFARGASAALVSKGPGAVDPGAVDPSRPRLVVGDTLAALRALARAARARSAARIVGVTGSVGKTGVKEALRVCLGALGPTHATQGSLNNHWGLPLSLARLPRETRYAVFEMGMNHPGEIRPLSQLARPHVAVITAVEAVHKAHFTSVQEIAAAKAEIFDGVEPGGIAVLNRDNQHFARLATAAGAAGIERIIAFGRHPEAGVRLVSADLRDDGSRVSADIAGERIDYDLPVAGAHWVQNSLCVLATVSAVGGNIRTAVAALRQFGLPKGRGQRLRLLLPAGPITLIDDSYNASPVSMAAAFAVLARAVPAPGGRRIAAIGDMLELGDDASDIHVGLAATLIECNVDRVFCAGPLMRHLYDALPIAARGAHAPDANALIPMLLAELRAGDVVVVKGSAGSRMSAVVQALTAAATTSSTTASAAGGDQEAPNAL